MDWNRDCNHMKIEMKEKTMIRITTTLALLAIAIAVPVAKAERPDAFGRAGIAHGDASSADAVPVERHSPDVQDAAFAAHQPSRSDRASSGPLDPGIAAAIRMYPSAAVRSDRRASYGPLDPGIAAAIRMYPPAAVPASTATGVNSDGFDWGDSGIGAGAMLALVFSLSSLRRGALIVRAKRSQALEA